MPFGVQRDNSFLAELLPRFAMAWEMSSGVALARSAVAWRVERRAVSLKPEVLAAWGGELDHLLDARGVEVTAFCVAPLGESSGLPAVLTSTVQGLEESGKGHGYSLGEQWLGQTIGTDKVNGGALPRWVCREGSR